MRINLLRAGSFRARIVLEKENYEDAEIINCEFEIGKTPAPPLHFNTFTRNFNHGIITKAEILGRIRGSGKTGYELKNIILPVSFGNQSGTAPNLQINLLKAGIFRAELTLEKAGYQDAKIDNCNFDIKKNAAPALRFNKFIGSIGEILGKTDILEKVKPDAAKTGYELKEIVLFPADFGEVSGMKPNLQIRILRSGNFRARIILEKAGYRDAVIGRAAFEIRRPPAPLLSFAPLVRSWNNGIITKDEILAQVRGAGKTGYELKDIILPSVFGNKRGAAPNLQIDLLKTGRFTAQIILEKAGRQDASIAVCSFRINKNPAPVLRFEPYFHRLGDGKIISKAKILGQIKGSGKAGYELKSISLSSGGFGAVSGTKPDLQIDLLKTGSFTGNIVLEKAHSEDAMIGNCNFAVVRKIFSWKDKLSKPVAQLGSGFTAAEIRGQIVETLSGYSIKSIEVPVAFGSVSGTKPLSISVRKGGVFKAKITFEHTDYFDVEVSGCEFEFVKDPAPATKPSWAATYDRILEGGKTITGRQISNNIRDIQGYKIKMVKDISDFDIAELSGSGADLELVLKKGGSFDANIVLEHDTKEDVELEYSDFTVEDPQIKSRKFTRYSEQGDRVSFEEIMKFSLRSDNSKWRSKSLSGVGYRIKKIVIPSAASDKIEKSLTGLRFKKLGSSTISVTLENPNYFDVTLDSEFAMIFDFAFGSDGYDKANQIIQMADSDYVLVGTSENTADGKGQQGYVVKISTLGVTRKIKKIGGNGAEEFNSIVELSDGVAIAGYKEDSGSSDKNFWVMKLDKNFNKVWEKDYGNNSIDEEAKKIIALSGGDLMVVGYKKNAGDGGWVMRLSGSDGTRRWEQTYGGNQDDKFNSIVELRSLTGSDLIVVGEKKNSINSDGWVMKINSNGTQKWEKIIKGAQYNAGPSYTHDAGDKLHDVAILGNTGRFAIAGGTNSGSLAVLASFSAIWVSYLDNKNGDSKNDYHTGSVHGSFNINSVIYNPAKNNSCFYAGSLEGSIPGLSLTSKGAKDGVVLMLEKHRVYGWSSGINQNFGGTGNDYITSIIQDKEGNIVAAGYTETRGTTSGYNFWVAKLDPNTLKIIGSF